MKSEKIDFLIGLATDLCSDNRNQVVYIAGKVTGLPDDEVRQKFADAQVKLEALGFKVLNPVTYINDVTAKWSKAMRIATTLLNMADHIYMLPDWQDSDGATLEFEMAQRFELNIMFADAEPKKGEYTGECYRTACHNGPAHYFNHSTQRYYCQSCAITINEADYRDAMKLYGHAMCTKGPYVKGE